ncbi:MAG: PAS domain S-box protein [Nitrospiraceae bacterium]
MRRQAAEEEVREKQASQDLVLRSLPIVMYVAKASEDFGALWVSDNVKSLTGFSPQEFISDSSLWSSRLHPLDEERALAEFAKLPQENTLSMEYRWQTRPGEYRWFRDEAVLIRRPDGVPQEIVGLWADVTARKQAESVIRRQADIIDQIEEAVITVDLDGRVTSWNKGAEKALGYSLTEALGKHISFIYPSDDRAFLEHEIIDRVKTTGTSQVEVRRQTKSGEVRFAQLSLTLLRDEAHVPVGIVGLSMDITDRKRAREELVQSRNQLEALAVRLESVREEERTRIALEVHDVLGQALTALKLDLTWIAQQIGDSNDQARMGPTHARLDSALGLISSTIGSVRELVTTLRPGVLDELGLAAAVEWLASDFQTRTGIACQVVIRPHRIGAGKEQSTALFRILQEILTNVARHAQATSAHIALEESDEELSLRVTDNGRGIQEQDRSGRRGFGLLGMRLRARQQGGDFAIEGTSGSGTTVTVRIPLYGLGE